jgi:large subunit ribosomal protein L1
MPNPKTGTVTFDVGKAVREFKGGKIEFRVEKAGIVHVPFGKASFPPLHLAENAMAILEALLRAKPASSKGRYLRGISISPTMGPGVRVDVNAVQAAVKV